MQVEIIRCLKDNYSYLIIDEKNKLACVIDPSESKPIINFLEKKNINLRFILNTHHHYDHVGGNSELKKKYKAEVVGFKGDKDRIPEIDIFLNDREIWKYENFESNFEVLVIDTKVPLDSTQSVCEQFGAKYINRVGDNTFGNAIRTGIAEAKGKYIIFMDSDGSHTPEFIKDLYEKRCENSGNWFVPWFR